VRVVAPVPDDNAGKAALLAVGEHAFAFVEIAGAPDPFGREPEHALVGDDGVFETEAREHFEVEVFRFFDEGEGCRANDIQYIRVRRQFPQTATLVPHAGVGIPRLVHCHPNRHGLQSVLLHSLTHHPQKRPHNLGIRDLPEIKDHPIRIQVPEQGEQVVFDRDLDHSPFPRPFFLVVDPDGMDTNEQKAPTGGKGRSVPGPARNLALDGLVVGEPGVAVNGGVGVLKEDTRVVAKKEPHIVYFLVEFRAESRGMISRTVRLEKKSEATATMHDVCTDDLFFYSSTQPLSSFLCKNPTKCSSWMCINAFLSTCSHHASCTSLNVLTADSLSFCVQSPSNLIIAPIISNPGILLHSNTTGMISSVYHRTHGQKPFSVGFQLSKYIPDGFAVGAENIAVTREPLGTGVLELVSGDATDQIDLVRGRRPSDVDAVEFRVQLVFVVRPADGQGVQNLVHFLALLLRDQPKWHFSFMRRGRSSGFAVVVDRCVEFHENRVLKLRERREGFVDAQGKGPWAHALFIKTSTPPHFPLLDHLGACIVGQTLQGRGGFVDTSQHRDDAAGCR
jgi:hypothetical protein